MRLCGEYKITIIINKLKCYSNLYFLNPIKKFKIYVRLEFENILNKKKTKNKKVDSV